MYLPFFHKDRRSSSSCVGSMPFVFLPRASSTGYYIMRASFEISAPDSPPSPPPARREMAQLSSLGDSKKTAQHFDQTCCTSGEDLICALLLRQYTPVAPSPLNPDTTRGRSLHSTKKSTPVVRKTPEISPTLRLLRRKAAIAYKRTTEQSLPTLPLINGARNAIIVADACETSADVTDDVGTVDQEDNLPAAFIVESGPLIQIVHFEYHRHLGTEDPEKQLRPDRSLFERWQGPRQRIQFFFVVCLMSSCLTFFSVVAFESLRKSPLLAS